MQTITKSKGRIQKFIETGDSRYTYQNDSDKVYFQHDMAYRNLKDFWRRTASDKVLGDKTFNIAKNPKYIGYQRGLASLVYNFLNKNTSSGAVKNEIMLDQRPSDLASR